MSIIFIKCGQGPHYINFPGGNGVKVPAQSVIAVEEKDLRTNEMVFHQNRNNISVVKQSESEEKAEPKAVSSEKPKAKAKPDEEPDLKAKADSGKISKPDKGE